MYFTEKGDGGKSIGFPTRRYTTEWLCDPESISPTLGLSFLIFKVIPAPHSVQDVCDHTLSYWLKLGAAEYAVDRSFHSSSWPLGLCDLLST